MDTVNKKNPAPLHTVLTVQIFNVQTINIFRYNLCTMDDQGKKSHKHIAFALFVITFLLIIGVLVFYLSSNNADTTSSVELKVYPSGIESMVVELTNNGTSKQSYNATITFYDINVKTGTGYASFVDLNPKETGLDTLSIPPNATRYEIEDVAAIIGGTTYRVNFTQTAWIDHCQNEKAA